MLHRTIFLGNFTLFFGFWILMIGSMYSTGVDWSWYMWKCHYWVWEGKFSVTFLWVFVNLWYCASVVWCLSFCKMVFLLTPFEFDHILLLCFHADSCICATYFREVVVPSKADTCNQGSHSYSNQRVGSPVSILIAVLIFAAGSYLLCKNIPISKYLVVLWIFISYIWLCMLCPYWYIYVHIFKYI